MSVHESNLHLAQLSISPNKLMEELVAISSEHWVGAARFIEMPTRYGIDDITLKIIFMKAVIYMLKDIPVPIFESVEIRNTIINAAQEALEGFIVEEESDDSEE
jgi:type III secretion system TyeA family effector delivery regulator